MPQFIMAKNAQTNIVENARILQAVCLAYIEAIYFTDTGESEQPESDAEMDRQSQFEAFSACADFLAHCEESGLLSEYQGTWEQFGHDFWLTRNGHGCGFWDRGLGELGDKLSKAAKSFSACDTYAGDDSRLYIG